MDIENLLHLIYIVDSEVSYLNRFQHRGKHPLLGEVEELLSQCSNKITEYRLETTWKGVDSNES